MERRVALSIREADTAEAKLELMDGVINKLKASIKILTSDAVKIKVNAVVMHYYVYFDF